MDLGLKGCTALVLGGGGGLGSAISCALSREGAATAVADLNIDAANDCAASIRNDGGKAFPLAWDLSDISAVNEKVSQVEKELGPIDILVNNTGGPPPSPVSNQPTATWRSHFESMVLSVISVTDRVLPGMKERKWGRIITSTSSGVISPIPNLGLSNALRASLLGWSKTLASEVARDGITVNIVLPGRIGTKRIKFLDEQKAKREQRSVDDVVKDSLASIPTGRYGNPEEYADVVTFLASRRSSYMTGTVIRVDGGMITSI